MPSPSPPFFAAHKLTGGSEGREIDNQLTRHIFDDGSSVLALHTTEHPLDASRSQLAPVAHMCIAAYAYTWLRSPTQGSEPELKPWRLQLLLLKDFWLAKQPMPFSPQVQRAADVLNNGLRDEAILRTFLEFYLKERGLSVDSEAVPNLHLHRLLFAEYFSAFPWQLGNSAEFDRSVSVVLRSEGAPVVVGNVLLGGCSGADAVAVMQGAISCPFYAQSVHTQRALMPPSLHLGVGDSMLLHVWMAYHKDPPQFCALRVQPLSSAPSWRARVLRLPFVCDWQGRPYSGASEDGEEDGSDGSENASNDALT